MANASPRDMRAGFEIYRTSGFSATLDEINGDLTSSGYGPVSARAHRHYRNLASAGFDHYVSINRFDVARAAVPYEGNTASPLYDYRDSDVGVRLTFAHKNSIHEELGTTARIGDAGALLRFEDPAGQRITEAKVGVTDSVRVTFFTPEMSTPARVLDVVRNEQSTLVEVEFARLHASGDYVGETTLPASQFHLRLLNGTDEDEYHEPPADVVGRRLYFTIELLEASRAVVNEYLTSNGRAEYAAPATVQRLRVESPQDLLASVSLVVGSLSTMALSVLAPYFAFHRARLTAGKADEQHQKARTAKAQADVDEARAAVQIRIYDELQAQLGEGTISPRLETLVDKQLFGMVESLAEQDIVEAESDTVSTAVVTTS